MQDKDVRAEKDRVATVDPRKQAVASELDSDSAPLVQCRGHVRQRPAQSLRFVAELEGALEP